MIFKKNEIRLALLSTTFSFVFIMDSMYCAQHLVNFDNAKVALRTSLRQNPDSGPLSIITVTRSSIRQGTTELISHDEFRGLLRILYALCSGRDAPFYSELGVFHDVGDFYWELEGAVPLDLNDVPVIQEQESDIEGICSSFKRYYDSHLADSCNIVVFNEMFFSQEMPLDVCQKDFINDKLLELSVSAPHTFFYPNYLYTEVRSVMGKTIRRAYKRMRRYTKMARMDIMDDMSVLTDCRAELHRQRVFDPANKTNVYDWTFLVNETYGVWNGHLVTRYKRSSYFNESNDSIRSGAVYDFGKGRDVVLDGTSPVDVKRALLSSVSTEICFDLANGIRSHNRWTNIKTGLPSVLHILQSNCIDPFDPTNIGNLPINIPIIYADSWLNYQKCGIPFYDGVWARGELPSMSHGITIGDSLYTFGVYSR